MHCERVMGGRALVLLLLLVVPGAARAEDEKLSNTERIVLAGVVGGALVTYGVVNTVFMFDDLLNRGTSEPGHIVPAGFLSGVALVASVAGLAVSVRARDEVGSIGGALATMSSLALCFFVTYAIHSWHIRQPVTD